LPIWFSLALQQLQQMLHSIRSRLARVAAIRRAASTAPTFTADHAMTQQLDAVAPAGRTLVTGRLQAHVGLMDAIGHVAIAGVPASMGTPAA
jgi:hypothetical protein